MSTDETRLKHAREAAAYKAWQDIFAAFTDAQRKQLANLFAHGWWIGEVTLRQTKDGRDYTHKIGHEGPDPTTHIHQ